MPAPHHDEKKEKNRVSDVSVPQLLLMHNRQEKVTNDLYKFRTLVSLGVLGFIYHNTEFSYDLMVKGALTFGFLMFSVGNGIGAVASQKITVAISNALESAARNGSPKYTDVKKEVLLAHSAISAKRMRWYQIVLTVVVLLAMWFPNIELWVKGIARK